MVNQAGRTNKTGWLAEYRHPSPSELFCLPSAIYFLMKFRADLARFNSKALDDRLTLYFWWEMTARETYPDFEWVLRPEDLEYLHQLDNESLIARHPRAVTYWLGSTAPSVLDTRHLAETMLESQTVCEQAGLQLPRLITMIVGTRNDLSSAFDLGTLTGYLNCLDWWEAHGQAACPRVTWSVPVSWPKLVEAIDDADADAMPFPRFLALIATERPDLRSAFDLNTFTGRLACLSWWKEHGHREYARIRWAAPPIGRAMLEPEQPVDDEGLDIPRFISLIIKERPDLQTAFNLLSFTGRISCLSWWLEHGQLQYRAIKWVPPGMPAPLFVMEWGAHPDWLPVPRFLRLILQERPDLQGSCNLDSFIGRLNALSWWVEHGQFQYPAILWDASALPAALFDMEPGEHCALPLIPRFLRLIWSERPDLQSAFNLDSFGARLSFLTWWDDDGKDEYLAIKWVPAGVPGPLFEMDWGAHPDWLPLPRFLRAILDERVDLQAFCAEDSFIGRLNALSWWVEHGQSQYPSIRWVTPGLPAELFEMEPGEHCALPLIPRFLSLIHNERPDLQTAFNLDSFGARLNYLSWWNQSGQNEYHAIKWSARGLADALARMGDEQAAGASPVARFLEMIANERPDLRAAFDIRTDAGREQLVHWWNEFGGHEYPLLGSLKVHRGETPAGAKSDEPPRYYARVEHGYGFGVNIVGFPQGVLGLGEDARMAARVLQLTSTPVVLVNAPMSGPAKLDTSVDHLLSDELKYGISLICLPAPEMVRLALEGGRKLIDAPTHKIGAWPWELPHWPSAFGKVHQMVDEIWAQSKFVQSVYSRLGDTPVYRMPMAVEVPAPVHPDRARFNLPANEFLFYLMFDGNSWLSRKNPLAGVQAFRQAFGETSPGVGLVIKAMNVRDDDPVWRAVCDTTAGDSRIHIVSERLSRQDSIDFMACCDSYISLHRSEGFGRVIAEAMALGQPVVVTNFSGNVDFCEPDTAFLVDGDLIPLRAGDYLFSEGQYWCDPDVSIAAEQLRRVIDDVALRECIAKAGQQRIVRDYSVEAVARAYARRLAEVKGK
ncbi:Glycosyl transferase group 1 [Paraburkholderia ribeironis]|uniref:Glycosyl transferase group 1 n=1 Tax=Paraburkholderia ribeironis TaxID=1247936 RepID=A0A1N7RMF5_9BURK|nr:glycosyltransferase [Paraburkholderia ribeironis]SIT36295.1 Glycosyl transferase group 1 [Paraburkholderia ribeironis]